MKTTAKEEKKKEGTRLTKKAAPKQEELKTDRPLSEKDEVKQAEANMRKTRKKSL
jgi:hypothetical protein